jgi:membrane protease YdiL (CAAX protease family)
MTPSAAPPVRTTGNVLSLGASVAVVFVVFDRSAAAFRSFRGEAGLLVCAIVLVALFVVSWLLCREPTGVTVRRMGFGRLATAGLAAALTIAAILIGVLASYARLADVPMSLVASWPVLAIGLFAQAGVAEEALFRAHLFGRLREGRTFWSAARLAMVPFAIVHLGMFFTMPPAIAAASLLLAIVISFPLARLYELGGRTLWAPAIVHAVIQGAIKVVAVPSTTGVTLPLVWMAASAIVPWLVFAVRRRER